MLTAANAITAGQADVAIAVGMDKHPRGAFSVGDTLESIGLGQWYGETGLALNPQYFAMIEGSRWSGRAGGNKGPIVSATQQDLYERAPLTDDLEERERLYDLLGREMISDAYILPLANPNLILAHRSNLKGMHYSGCCNVELGFLYRVKE